MDPLIESYYQSIILLHDKEKILKELLEPEYDNFYTVMNSLIERLQLEKEKLLNEKDKFTEEEYHELIIPEIQSLEEKINLCKSKIEKEKEEELEIEELEELSKTELHKDLIFATTRKGNICIEEDLKDIQPEFYERIFKCLARIEDNNYEGNLEKERLFSSTNKKLRGVYEKKEYQVRVLYKHLTPDTAFVLLIKTKKSNNDKQDKKEAELRNELVTEEYNFLKKDMKDEELKKQIIEQNKIIKQRIFKLLGKTKGEAKHG